MAGLGIIELSLLLVLVLLFFSAGRLTSIGKLSGWSVRSFRQGVQDAEAFDVTPSGHKRFD